MHSGMQVMPQKTADRLTEEVRAVAVAVEQITVALHEAQQPVEELGVSVSRIIVTVGALRLAAADLPESAREAVLCRQINGAIDKLSTDAAQATITLQFYDRMTQHLTHLQDYLAGVVRLMASRPVPAGAPLEMQGWHKLHRELSSRLMSDLQRQHLRGMTPEEWGDMAMVDARSIQGSPPSSVELF